MVIIRLIRATSVIVGIIKLIRVTSDIIGPLLEFRFLGSSHVVIQLTYVCIRVVSRIVRCSRWFQCIGSRQLRVTER